VNSTGVSWCKGSATSIPSWISYWINHGLYGSTSCCTSQWQSQWGWANFDPSQLRNRL